jgi:hypothetical protein
VAEFLEENFIKPQHKRITVFVNNELMPLDGFPEKLVYHLLSATAATFNIKEGEIKSIALSMRL